MNFNVKDVKSWVNRYEVKVGDKGYVSSDLYSLQDDLKNNVALIREISRICYDDVECFSCKAFGTIRSYGFFLPLDAVKADEPKEKKYRPFRTVAEVDELLTKDSVKHYCYVGSDLYLRYKAYPNITKHIEITNLEVDTNTNELRFINGFTPRHLAENYEIKIAGCWLPFGVEENED